MAEFQVVARHWKRMCKRYWRVTTCHGCPIAEHERAWEACSAYEADVVKMEELVMSWAAEHPEPVYPTWEEWLVDNGVFAPDNILLNGEHRFFFKGEPMLNIPTEKLFTPIPADIAGKLGIEPKEG